ncbi:MAG TPA: enolase C-terminal domain-like protein [Solirubrobacteraceae bacterium]|nr:enolase C-terminal domain-like protein [Solirubrobacteraceae bacterium]
MKLELERRSFSFSSEAQASYGTLGEREVIQVRLSGRDGEAGFGEAAPLAAYDGVSLARVERVLQGYAAALDGIDGGAPAIESCRAVDPLPQALAAVDIALWDMAGRREGRPVCELLADPPARSVAVNATIADADRAGAARSAASAVADGFGCLKVKVGLGDDAARVAAVRAAAGNDVLLRLDANGAWDVATAVAMIGALEGAGLELVEEPVHGVDAIRSVRDRVAVRVAIDETASEAGALAAGCADAVCLKVSACGGITPLLAAASLVRAGGGDVYLASTFDGPLGVAAALHAAAALASTGPVAHCGLATLALFSDAPPVLAAERGRIEVPRSAGLGVEPV